MKIYKYRPIPWQNFQTLSCFVFSVFVGETFRSSTFQYFVFFNVSNIFPFLPSILLSLLFPSIVKEDALEYMYVTFNFPAVLRAQFSNLFFYSSFSLSFPFVASKYRRIQLSTTVHLILASLLRLEDVPFISQIFLFFLLNPRNTRHSISQNPPNSRFQFFSLLLILYLDSCYSLLPVPASSVQSRDKLAPLPPFLFPSPRRKRALISALVTQSL